MDVCTDLVRRRRIIRGVRKEGAKSFGTHGIVRGATCARSMPARRRGTDEAGRPSNAGITVGAGGTRRLDRSVGAPARARAHERGDPVRGARERSIKTLLLLDRRAARWLPWPN